MILTKQEQDTWDELQYDIRVSVNGTTRYFLNGVLHRISGPAVVYKSGGQYYYLNGEPHRIGGPAVTRPDGTAQYWENGVFIK